MPHSPARLPSATVSTPIILDATLPLTPAALEHSHEATPAISPLISVRYRPSSTPVPLPYTTAGPNKLETQPARPPPVSASPDTASTTPPPPDPTGTATDKKCRLCSDQTDSNENEPVPPTPRIQLAVAAVHPTDAGTAASDPHDRPIPFSTLAATLPHSLPATFAQSTHRTRPRHRPHTHRPHILGTPQLPTCLQARESHSA